MILILILLIPILIQYYYFIIIIINKLIHTIYTSNNQYFDNLSQNIKNPYLESIKIDSIKTDLSSSNKTLNSHLNKKWSVIYKNSEYINDFNKTYKNSNTTIYNLLIDDFIPVIKNNLLLDIIKSLHISKTKNYILTKFNKTNTFIFSNSNNITKFITYRTKY